MLIAHSRLIVVSDDPIFEDVWISQEFSSTQTWYNYSKSKVQHLLKLSIFFDSYRDGPW